MMDLGIKIKKMDKEFTIIIQLGKNTKELGKMVKDMEEASIILLMETNMMDSK